MELKREKSTPAEASSRLRKELAQAKLRVAELERLLSEDLADSGAEKISSTARHEILKGEAILEGLGVGVIIQDLDYRILYENSFQQTITGSHIGELCYRAYENLDTICENCPMVFSLEDGKIHQAQTKVETPEGTRHYELTTSPLRDASGKVVGGIKVVRDVTDLNRAVERNRQAQKNLENILETTPYGVVIIDNDKTVIHANKAALTMMGYEKPGDIVGQVCHETLCPSEADKCPILDLGQQLDRSDKLLVKKDGTRIPILKTVVPVMFDDEELLLEAFVDMSALKEAETFIRDILESVDEAFLVVSPEYRIISANRAYLDQLQKTDDDVVGRPCYELTHGLDRPCFLAGEDCPVKATFETGQPKTFLHVHTGPDGEKIHVETKSFPLKNQAGEIFAAIEIINDLTEKRQLEEQLRHSQKMEALGTLTGGLAHEFNNIMTVVMGFAELLERDLPRGSTGRDYAGIIVKSAKRAADLTESLLAYSRKKSSERVAIDLNLVLRTSATFLERLAGENIDFCLLPSTEELIVNADRAQLEQVLLNLARNSVDEMPGGGTLTISSELVLVDEDSAGLHGDIEPGEYARLCVADTGLGMDDETRAKAFEPFFTTKEVGKGTGLGLSVVYGIVQQHDGTITVESEVGKGTLLCIYLPICRNESALPAQATDHAGAASLGTILVADDEEMVRLFIRKVLEDEGYTVIEAVDGVDAIQRFHAHARDIDLCMFDISMPNMNGLDCFREIQSLRPEARVVFVSGHGPDHTRVSGMRAAGFRVVQKPVSGDVLLEEVRGALHQPS